MSKIFDMPAVEAALKRAAKAGVSGTRAERSGRFVLDGDTDAAGADHAPAPIGTGAVKRITIDPEVCGGRPCIRGLRISVNDILDMLAGGATRKEILDDYPDLEDEDINVALAYATEAPPTPR